MTPAEWFGTADQFFAAARLLDEQPAPAFFHPLVTCYAFASEAYLKCLLTLRGKAFPSDHDLHRLFKLLHRDDQKAIETGWNENSLPMTLRAAKKPPAGYVLPITLNGTLKACGTAFKDWRYRTKETFFWGLASFPMDVRDVILSVKREWVADPPDSLGRPQSHLRIVKQK